MTPAVRAIREARRDAPPLLDSILAAVLAAALVVLVASVWLG